MSALVSISQQEDDSDCEEKEELEENEEIPMKLETKGCGYCLSLVEAGKLCPNCKLSKEIS